MSTKNPRDLIGLFPISTISMKSKTSFLQAKHPRLVSARFSKEFCRTCIARRSLSSLAALLIWKTVWVGESLSSQLDPASTLEPLLETQFVDSDDRVPPIAALFPAQFRALCKLHKVALLCSKLKIKLPQLKWLPTATSSRTFDVLQLDALPSRSGDPAPSLDAWKQLVLLFGLRDLRDGATLSQLFLQRVKFFLGVQAPTDVQQKMNDQHSYLAQALHSPVEDVRWASVEKLSLQWSADYGSPTRETLFPLLINAWLARAVGLSSQDSVDASHGSSRGRSTFRIRAS